MHSKAKRKKSPVSGHRSASKSVQWCVFCLFYFRPSFFLLVGKYVIHCIRRDQISHVQSMVAKRGLTNQANVHTPTCMWTSCLKHSTAEFESIQQLWLQKKQKIKNADAQVWGNMRGDQKPDTFLGGLTSFYQEFTTTIPRNCCKVVFQLW